MSRSCSGLASTVGVLALLGVACFQVDDDPIVADDTETGDGDPTTGDGDPTTTGDGDPTTGDGDPTTGDGDPTTTTGDGDPTTTGDGDPDTDSDGDGIPDSVDNCPDHPNPNQLDFNGNGVGNVCDTVVFTNVTGTLNSTLVATSGGFGSCNVPINLDVFAGEIHVQLDDEATLAAFDIVELQVADILEAQCNVFPLNIVFSIKDFTLANVRGPAEVPHSQAYHDAGEILGSSDGPQLMAVTVSLEVDQAQEPAPVILDGSLPIFATHIVNGGSVGLMDWGDPLHVLAEDQFIAQSPFGTMVVDYQFRGVVGTLNLQP